MDERNDGDAAFPCSAYRDEGGMHATKWGMSLRDWFAGMAMQGFIASGDWQEFFDGYTAKGGPEDPTEASNEAVACSSYGIADEMLKARETKKK